MKFLIGLLLVASNLSSLGVIVSFNTITGEGPFAIVDAADALIPQNTGFVGVGFFRTTTDANLSTTSAAALESDFALFGQATAFNFDGLDGFYDFQSNGGRVSTASPFFGENLYTFIGNASTIGASTNFAIFRHDVTFPDDSEAPIDAALSAPIATDGMFLAGGLTGSTVSFTTDQGTFDVPTIRLIQAVPEPSALLLSAFGALALLRRKR